MVKKMFKIGPFSVFSWYGQEFAQNKLFFGLFVIWSRKDQKMVKKMHKISLFVTHSLKKFKINQNKVTFKWFLKWTFIVICTKFWETLNFSFFVFQPICFKFCKQRRTDEKTLKKKFGANWTVNMDLMVRKPPENA